MGYAKVYPLVKLAKRPYEYPRFPPVLRWCPIHKGMYRVGEILACFELIQVIMQNYLLTLTYVYLLRQLKLTTFEI